MGASLVSPGGRSPAVAWIGTSPDDPLRLQEEELRYATKPPLPGTLGSGIDASGEPHQGGGARADQVCYRKDHCIGGKKRNVPVADRAARIGDQKQRPLRAEREGHRFPGAIDDVEYRKWIASGESRPAGWSFRGYGSHGPAELEVLPQDEEEDHDGRNFHRTADESQSEKTLFWYFGGHGRRGTSR